MLDAINQVNDSIAMHPDDLTDTEMETSDTDTGAGCEEQEEEPLLSEDEGEDSEDSEDGEDGEDCQDIEDETDDDGDDYDAACDDDVESVAESSTEGDLYEEKALEEIRKFQNSTGYLIPFANFNRLVREIGQDFKLDLRFTKNAIMALQSAAESHVVGILSMAQRLAIHADRIGVRPKDVSFAVHLDKCGGHDSM